MKQTTNKAKIYEIIYKVLQSVLYIAIVGISIAYLIFLFIGQEKRIFFNIEITLMFAVLVLWKADILIRKKLRKNNIASGKRDKKHSIAVCVALVGAMICAVSFAIMSFCNVSGTFAFAMGIVTLLAALTTAIALAVEHSINIDIKAEDRAGKEEDKKASNGEEKVMQKDR